MTNQIALTIAEQLGGNKFTAMTGATLVTVANGLIVRLPRKARDGINSVVFKLDAGADLYDVQFNSISKGGMQIDLKLSAVAIPACLLRKLFTTVTGLAVSL